jgi:hypothetical protein
MPSGGHGPDASIFGMTSSYFFAFMLGADVKRAKMLMSFSPDPEPRAPYPSSKRSSPYRNGAMSDRRHHRAGAIHVEHRRAGGRRGDTYASLH